MRGNITRPAILAITAIFTANLALAQDVAGSWVAHPADSGALRSLERFVLKFSRDRQGALSGTMYAGNLGDLLFGCSSISVSGSKVTLVVESQGSSGAKSRASTGLVMSFTGTVSGDGRSIAGWMQGPGFNERLKFDRMGKAHAPAAAPPATAAAAAADSSALLARALAKLAGTRRQLVKYTCIETIERSYYSAAATKMSTDATSEAPHQSCSGLAFSTDGHLTLNAEDRLRLEVAVADGKEMDSWASANSFDSRSIHDVVSTGPTSTGAFGTALVDVFENRGAHYTFLGQMNRDSRVVFAYSFDVPEGASHSFVKLANGWDKTAYHGSFEIDASTAELTRLVTETADLPAEAKACRYRTSTDYHYQPIGDGQYLIPLKSDFDVLLPNDSEDRSAIVFSGCHEYRAESSIILDGEAPLAATQATPKSAPPLPPGISLTLVLVNPIDTRTAAAGDAITAKVAKAVRASGSDDVLVAAGAVAHGRILQMRHEIGSGQFLISIYFETLEQNGAVGPLAVRSDRELKAEQAQAKGRFASRGTEFGLPPAASAGETGSWFTLSAMDGRAILAAGFESKWITVAALSQDQ
jgi:hypothetical protein